MGWLITIIALVYFAGMAYAGYKVATSDRNRPH